MSCSFTAPSEGQLLTVQPAQQRLGFPCALLFCFPPGSHFKDSTQYKSIPFRGTKLAVKLFSKFSKCVLVNNLNQHILNILHL